MKACHVSNQIAEHAEKISREEERAEWEDGIIRDYQTDLESKIKTISNEDLELLIREKHDQELIDFFDDHIHDDGVWDYFFLHQVQFEKDALKPLFDWLDYHYIIKEAEDE